jgi:hypothetical protein
MGYGREGNTVDDDELIKWHADEMYQKHARLRDQPDSEKKEIETEKRV